MTRNYIFQADDSSNTAMGNPEQMNAIIQVLALTKHYKTVRAVDGVNLSIPNGSCFGLLGPNGAGKTTTIEMIEGIRSPTSGQILYKDKPMGNQFKFEIGIQFQTTALPDFLTVFEVVNLFRSFYTHTIAVEDLVKMCSLEDILHRDTRKLSGGQRQRVLLAIALVNDPEVLFLDEPTTGLDPQARRNFWTLIESIKKRNKTIILTTHYMEEAYVLCDEIAIMDSGKVIAGGEPKNLLEKYFKGVRLRLPAADFRMDKPSFPWPIYDAEAAVEIQTSEKDKTLRYLMDGGTSLSGLEIKSPTLEDLFLELTGKQLRN